LAALTAALLLGFQLVQTYWFYTYIPWFFPFLAFALLAGETRQEQEALAAEPRPDERRTSPIAAASAT
jgi:hypothetical protein